MSGSVKDGGFIRWEKVGSVHSGQLREWAEAYVKHGGAWVKIWPIACPAPTGLSLSASGTDNSLHPMASATDADEYRFRHRLQGAASWTTLDWQTASDIMLTGLTGGTVRDVCVKARRDCGHTVTETDWLCRSFTVNQSHDLSLTGRIGVAIDAPSPVEQNLSASITGRIGINIAPPEAEQLEPRHENPSITGRIGINISEPQVNVRRVIPRAPTNPTINFVG